ncbi:MAG: T9SS type A sorting domain-containing protein [Ignavibacteria bacterium]|nr:T9SS type A sorting domain-containing protein [Ignavibacteria bacterium]
MTDSTLQNFERAFVRTLDNFGNVIIEKFFRPGGSSNAFYSVELTKENGFVLCGYSKFVLLVAYIVRTDSLFNIKPVGINNKFDLIKNFSIEQNYPNPFNPVTNVEFGISKSGFVTLKVYDILGKEVATLVNENLSPGKYTVKFNGSNLSSGVYFCRMEFSGNKKEKNFQIKKMILIK